MRIISGRWGGRKLKSFKAPWIRPTSDVVKGSMFNKLQGAIDGARVLDLFAGTGNLSLEALSRGAAQVTAVDKHPGSIRILRENAALLGAGDELRVVAADVFVFLKTLAWRDFDLVFIDPPFTEKLSDKVMQSLAKGDMQDGDPVVVIESARAEKLSDSYGGLTLWDRKEFGDKFVSYYRVL